MTLPSLYSEMEGTGLAADCQLRLDGVSQCALVRHKTSPLLCLLSTDHRCQDILLQQSDLCLSCACL